MNQLKVQQTDVGFCGLGCHANGVIQAGQYLFGLVGAFSK
jgi:hypothetical protein